MYECVFETTLQQVKEQISLTVKGKAPEMLSVLEPIYVMEENTMEIVCKSSGVPKPTLLWYLNETLVRDSLLITEVSKDTFMESRITVPRIRSNQAGVYKCRASNNYGSRETFSKVHVMKRTSVQISDEGVIRTKAGNRLTLPCTYKGKGF